MNLPILFGPESLVFSSYGIGVLKETSYCKVKEERNGEFELEMKYPVSGKRFDDIKNRCIVVAKPSPGREQQPFRIYRITKPYKGQITIYAQHISYDLSGYPVDAFEAGSAEEACRKLETKAIVRNMFSFSTDIEKEEKFISLTPTSVRSLLGGNEGTIQKVFGGEWLYDVFNLYLLEERGENKGVTIRYGKNLTTLEQEENVSDLYTGVLPYWYSEEEGLVTGSIQNAPGTFNYVRIMTVDFSDKHTEMPTVAELNIDAQDYIQEKNIGNPKISIKTSFADIERVSDGLNNSVELCDEVTVIFEKLGISKTAKVICTEYDVLKDRYINIEIGDESEDITDTIANQTAKLKKATTKSEMQKAINYATQLIAGNKGGYVVFNDSDGDKFPDEILIMDEPDKETATKVWRWNESGLGHSNNGYEGPYGLAMTIDGAIVADYITAGTLNAENVNVTNINGQNILDETVGEWQMEDYAISYWKTSGGVQDSLDQIDINAVDIEWLSADLASFQVELASEIITESLIINDPSFYYNGAKMTFVGVRDTNGNYRECLGW